MTKVREYGTTKEVVARLFQKIGHKHAAMLLGIGISSAYSYCDPDCATQATFDHVRRLTAATGNISAAEDLAQLAGGVFMPIDPDAATAVELASRSAEDHARMISALIVAVADGQITPKECGTLLEESGKLLRVIVALRVKLNAIQSGAAA
jgi:hypothetical protein